MIVKLVHEENISLQAEKSADFMACKMVFGFVYHWLHGNIAYSSDGFDFNFCLVCQTALV